MNLLNFINFFRRSPKTEPSITKIKVDFSNIGNQPEVTEPKSDDNRVRYKKYMYNEPHQNTNAEIGNENLTEDITSRKRFRLPPLDFFNNKVGTPYSRKPIHDKIGRVYVQPPHYQKGSDNVINAPKDPSIFCVKNEEVKEVKEVKNKTSFLQKLKSCCATDPNSVVSSSSAKYKV